MKNKPCNTCTAIGAMGSAIGKGLIAGLAGTAAITLSQAIEMKITKRQPSKTPAKGAEKVLDIQPEEGTEDQFSNRVHWAYGTLWGTARGLLSLCGLSGFAATAAHFTAIYAGALAVPTQLDLAPPLDEWKPKHFATGIIHHLVYAIAAGLVYDAINKKK